ncbi:MAG TPA: 4-alpha-glucanotransferase [Solirubrobacteraceae bacterium]
MDITRASGVQLHPTSLPEGRLGDGAYAFVDWLAAAGQSWWQMLPLGPPDKHGSPYKAASAFAAWRGLLADPDAPVSGEEVEAFRARHAGWVAGWEAFAGAGAVEDQVRFEREWAALREYAAARGVKLIGDIPIYVAPGSADQVAHPEIFLDGVQAGVPPDAFSEDGQLWGNPIYDWPALRRQQYRWWTARFERVFELFDVARIDHFRAFVAYWAVPGDAVDARGGRWRRGPGRAVFDAARAALGRDLPLIAENLGVITPPVERLRRDLGLPGMVVIQFGFNPDDPRGPHRPENHTEDSVVYTGTHDSDTLRGFWATAAPEQREEAFAALARAGIAAPRDEADIDWALIELAWSSPARLAMLQIQDVLGLGSEARMNMPGTIGRSWRWRMQPGALTGEHAARLRAVTEAAGRLG